jgi:hypothetical protein
MGPRLRGDDSSELQIQLIAMRWMLVAVAIDAIGAPSSCGHACSPKVPLTGIDRIYRRAGAIASIGRACAAIIRIATTNL